MSDAKPDVPPPRYVDHFGTPLLVADEQEWLTRPNLWALRELEPAAQERKLRLADYYNLTWFLQRIDCPVCRPLVARLVTEDGLNFGLIEGISQAWYDESHSMYPARCEVWPIWFSCIRPPGGISMDNQLLGILQEIPRHQPETSELIQWRVAHEHWKRDIALELIGPNPFRPVAFDPAWRTPTATALASQMYESRDFGAMPILADALQDAGCNNDDILHHCRDAKQAHVRGCWVVDLVLGKA